MTTPDLRTLAAALGTGPEDDLRLRKGTVTSVQTGTCTVRVGGSTVDVPGVVPVGAVTVGGIVWLLQQGPLLLAVGSPGGLGQYQPRGTVNGAVGVGGQTTQITNLNQNLTSGWYDGVNMTGQPPVGAGQWFLVEVIAHSNVTNYVVQNATQMTGAIAAGRGRKWSRTCEGGDPTVAGSWSAWVATGGWPLERGAVFRNTDMALPAANVETQVYWGIESGAQWPSSWLDVNDTRRLVLPAQARPGYYVCTAQVPFSLGGNAILTTSIRKNFSGIVAIDRRRINSNSNVEIVSLQTPAVYMIPGDAFTFWVQSDIGGALSGGYYINPLFEANYVGPA